MSRELLTGVQELQLHSSNDGCGHEALVNDRILASCPESVDQDSRAEKGCSPILIPWPLASLESLEIRESGNPGIP